VESTTDRIELDVDGPVLEVNVSGKLTKEAYERFEPVVAFQIERFGKVRILLVLHDFHGWTAGALWDDTQFELRHCRDIERLAVVGEAKWEEGMAVFCKPFTSAAIRYFDLADIDEARRWVTEG